MLCIVIVLCSLGVLSVCFFKQKTAYEMRISDWSSDVCSSDLHNSTMKLNSESTLPATLDAPGANTPNGVMTRSGDEGASRSLRQTRSPSAADRKSVVSGQSVSGRVDLGGRRIIKKQTTHTY